MPARDDPRSEAAEIAEAVRHAIEICDGNVLGALTAAIIGMRHLEAEIDGLQAQVSRGFVRGEFYGSMERSKRRIPYAPGA